MPGKPRNEVLNTTSTVTKLFLRHTRMHHYSTFIVAILLDMTSQMLYCTLAMNTTKHAFHCFFFNEKYCTLIVYITEFSQKRGGGQCITAPQSILGGGHGPPTPPVADSMLRTASTRSSTALYASLPQIPQSLIFTATSNDTRHASRPEHTCRQRGVTLVIIAALPQPSGTSVAIFSFLYNSTFHYPSERAENGVLKKRELSPCARV